MWEDFVPDMAMEHVSKILTSHIYEGQLMYQVFSCLPREHVGEKIIKKSTAARKHVMQRIW